MDYSIDYKPTLRELQSEVAAILNDAEYIKARGIIVLSEDLLDIDYQIKSTLGKQGLVIVVNTMQATYLGHDGLVNAWQIDNLEIDVVENPTVWRPYLKKHGFENGTTTDILHMMAEILGGPQSGIFGRFNPKSIEVGEDSSLVVGKLKLQTTVRQNVEGVVEEPTKVEIPFVTKVEIADLIAEIDSLKALVEDFSTEEIKADIADLQEADTELGARIDGLADVYQPKGAYALTSDLAPYALKTQIPVEISQLNNDVGYVTETYWDEVKQKPDVALASDIPTNVSQLNNDSNYLTSVSWSQIQDKPDIPEDIPTKTSDLMNDSGFLTEVAWNDIQSKPSLVDEEKLNEATRNRPTFDQMNTVVDEKISHIPASEDAKRLWDDTKTQYISGSREVFEVTTTPAHYTEWQFSDGQSHEIDMIETPTQYKIPTIVVIVGDMTRKYDHVFDSPAEARQFLDTATEIEFSGDGVESIFATRQYIEERQTTEKIAVLADTSQILTKTSQLENDAGFISEVNWDDISDKPDVALQSQIPTKTSDLANDSGFLTEHQSLEAYASKQWIEESGYLKEVTWDSIKMKPDVAEKSELETKAQDLQDQIDQIEAEIVDKERVKRLYNDRGFQYIDGDGWVYQIDDEGQFQKTDEVLMKSQQKTKTSELENDAGFLTEAKWSDIVGKPDVPTKTSELVNDSGFLTSVSWQEVVGKPDVPTKTSDLVNDSGFLTEVDWSDVTGKPEIVEKRDLDSLETSIDQKLETKMDKSDVQDNYIYNSLRTVRIGGDGEVQSVQYIPGEMTPWEYSDGQQHDDPLVYKRGSDEEEYYDLAIDQDTWTSKVRFESSEAAEEWLSTSDYIEYTSSEETLTATRTLTPSREVWTTFDHVAMRSEIPENQMTEDEVRQIVEGYGYQNQSQVQSTIEGYDYQTESQVDSRIDSRGFQNEAQVRSIAAETLPTGYVETEFVATLEDDTEVTFYMLTRGVAQ